MNVNLAARIIAGAHTPPMILTLPEASELLNYLARNPRAAAIVNGTPVEIRTLPVIVLDPDELDLTIDPDPWARQVLASWCEGLIDADDADRLLRRPNP